MSSFSSDPTSIIAEAEVRTKELLPEIDKNRDKTIAVTAIDQTIIPYVSRHVGKVRDVYVCEDYVIMVTTDRQSAFDRNLASVPFKGQALNLTSQWWFEQTASFVPNHVIACPHPNITIGKKCAVFSVEFVMRGYITGSTSTSIWTNYDAGVRQYCGHLLPEGLLKNQKLAEPLLTPTTKDKHDELISAEEIISSGRMTAKDWATCASYSHELFKFSQRKSSDKGLILVDTKYEFGKDADGNILLIDEIQTPDSSRYWLAASYEDRMAAGLEPENIDKEFLRKWFVSKCDPYKDEVLPEAPRELINELSRRYIMIYEILTGLPFSTSPPALNLTDSLRSFISNRLDC